MLDKVALGVLVFLICLFAAIIVFIGGIPGKVARKRNHPWPDAVNTAGWIGLATGVLWPLALVWAFFPFPSPNGGVADSTSAMDDVDQLQKRLAALEATVAKLPSKSKGADA